MGDANSLAATIILVFMWRAPAVADEIRILSSPGGQVGPFVDLFEGVSKMGDRVVIDGPCMSACTSVLSQTIEFASPAGQYWVFMPRVQSTDTIAGMLSRK